MVEMKDVKTKDVRWYWREDEYQESANGSFASREEAIQDARESCDSLDSQTTVLVGICQRIDPSVYLPTAEGIIRSMNESALDGLFAWLDGDAIEVREGGERVLDNCLENWCKLFCGISAWITSEEEETVTLG